MKTSAKKRPAHKKAKKVSNKPKKISPAKAAKLLVQANEAHQKQIAINDGRDVLIKGIQEQNQRMMAYHLDMVSQTTGQIRTEDVTYCNTLSTRIIAHAVREYDEQNQI